jgi:hypothetical protein
MKIKYAALTLIATLALVGCQPASDSSTETPSAPAATPTETPAVPDLPASTNVVSEAPAVPAPPATGAPTPQP